MNNTNIKENNFDFDLIIIGAGPGGYETAIYASDAGLKVALVEKEYLGGTCLNCGCIPTKTYYSVANLVNHLDKAKEFGIELNYDTTTFDFSKTYEKKEEVINNLRQGVNFSLKKSGVQIFNGLGSLLDKNTVKIVLNETLETINLTSKNIIIATGSKNLDKVIKGSQYALSSTEILALNKVPSNLVIIGGGVIGIEMASIFEAFGSNVTVIELADTILPNMDKEITRRLTQYLKQKDICIKTKYKVLEILENKVIVENLAKNSKEEISFDKALLAIGRTPNLENLNLEKFNLEFSNKGIICNDNFQTNISNIYAIGDCQYNPKSNKHYMLAHFATYSGKIAVDHLLNKPITYEPNCPSAVFTFPEVASVGITEEEAKEQKLDYKCNKVLYRSNGKALAMNEPDGFIKTIIANDLVIGCHIIGNDASTLIHEAVIMMNSKTKVSEAKKYIFAHPTLSEIFLASLK